MLRGLFYNGTTISPFLDKRKARFSGTPLAREFIFNERRRF